MSLWSAPSNDKIGRGEELELFLSQSIHSLSKHHLEGAHTSPVRLLFFEGLLNSSWNCPQCWKLLFLNILKGGKSSFFMRGSALGVQCGWPGQPGYLPLPFPLHPKQSASVLLLNEALEDLSKNFIYSYGLYILSGGEGVYMNVCVWLSGDQRLASGVILNHLATLHWENLPLKPELTHCYTE